MHKLIRKVIATLSFAVDCEWLMHVSVLQTFWLQVLETFKCCARGRSDYRYSDEVVHEGQDCNHLACQISVGISIAF